jgi:aldose 1-epimerase
MAAEPKIIELSNGTITARMASWGATITSLLVPDAHGQHRISVSGFVESIPR